MLDIEIYLDILEFIHATAGGEGVQVLFCILNRYREGSEMLVIPYFLPSLMAACGAISKRGKFLLKVIQFYIASIFWK